MTTDWKIEAKSDQLNADDLIGGRRIIVIAKVSARNDAAQPIAIEYEGGQGRPWLPCKGMRRVLVAIWGANGASFVGRRIELYREPSVKYGGIEVGGIRISRMSHMDCAVTIPVAVARGKKTAAVIKPLTDDQPAAPQSDAHTAPRAAPDTAPSIQVISDAQRKRLEARITGLGLDRERVKAWCKAALGVEHFADIPAGAYDGLYAKLDGWAAATAKEEAAAERAAIQGEGARADAPADDGIPDF